MLGKVLRNEFDEENKCRGIRDSVTCTEANCQPSA